jgi:hypothetical protein
MKSATILSDLLLAKARVITASQSAEDSEPRSTFYRHRAREFSDTKAGAFSGPSQKH